LTWAVRGALIIALAFALSACVKEVPRDDKPTVSPTSQSVVPTGIAVTTPEPTTNPVIQATNTPVQDTSPVPTKTSGLDPTATPYPPLLLNLDVRGPEDGATVQTDGVVVHGFAPQGSQVEINGGSVSLDENGRFSSQVDLNPGDNEIFITASKGAALASETLHITSLVLPPQPFFLLVTQPEDQSIISAVKIPLAGRTVPGAVVSVNGVSVPVDAVGIYATTLSLDEGPNIIDVLATNVDGEVLSTIIAVIYRP